MPGLSPYTRTEADVEQLYKRLETLVQVLHSKISVCACYDYAGRRQLGKVLGSMKILGISPLDKDSTVSFMEDGKVLFACGEERLSRVKLQSGFPHRALELGLKRTGWSLTELEHVAYAFFDANEEGRLIRKSAEHDRVFQTTEGLEKSASIYRGLLTKPYSMESVATDSRHQGASRGVRSQETLVQTHSLRVGDTQGCWRLENSP